jgi:hypothetical protein
MAITRADLLDYAEVQHAELAAEAGISLVDTSAGIKLALDQAVNRLGDDTANLDAAYALTDYYVLQRVWYALAARVDFDATAVQRNRSQVFNQVYRLLEDAQRRCAAAGHAVTAERRAQLVDYTVDYLEPALEEWQ